MGFIQNVHKMNIWRSPYAGSKYHGSPWLLSLLGPLTAKRIEGQPDHILGPLPSKSSILQIDRLENVFTKRKNVLKPKFHNFKKYTFRSWILCFCYLFYFFFVFLKVKVQRWVTESQRSEPQVVVVMQSFPSFSNTTFFSFSFF